MTEHLSARISKKAPRPKIERTLEQDARFRRLGFVNDFDRMHWAWRLNRLGQRRRQLAKLQASLAEKRAEVIESVQSGYPHRISWALSDYGFTFTHLQGDRHHVQEWARDIRKGRPTWHPLP